MIADFNARFDAAYDLRLYQQVKGYTDASPDTWEYLVWEPQDGVEVCNEVTLDDYFEGETEEF